jgi:3-hydroxyisobutyrate dehydrogenase-like beta-hydroxyacid dehydrogenase
MKNIGFVGLGSMGQGMALNLVKAGYQVKVYNRTAAKAGALVAAGAKAVAHPDEAADPGGIVVSMVSDDASLLALAQGPHGFGPALGKGGLHISMSTVNPATNRLLADELQAQGSSLVAAPVFGRPDAAAAAKLFIPCSGPSASRARALEVLNFLGQRVADFGEEVGAANVIKLSGNYLLVAATQAIAESLAVAEANGVPRQEAMDFFTSTVFACPAYINYGNRIAAEDYAPGGFKLSLGAKDLRLFSSQPGAQGLPLNDLINRNLAKALQAGQGDLDVTAISLQVGKS